MKVKAYLAGITAAALLLAILGSGCAPSSGYKNPDVETTKQRTAGTSDELSPQAPVGATNVKKVGNQWTCEQNGRLMVYNDAASRWEPKQK
jgi:ABC-type oligopeptide transport system substrate-binding subunit